MLLSVTVISSISCHASFYSIICHLIYFCLGWKSSSKKYTSHIWTLLFFISITSYSPWVTNSPSCHKRCLVLHALLVPTKHGDEISLITQGLRNRSLQPPAPVQGPCTCRSVQRSSSQPRRYRSSWGRAQTSRRIVPVSPSAASKIYSQTCQNPILSLPYAPSANFSAFVQGSLAGPRNLWGAHLHKS